MVSVVIPIKVQTYIVRLSLKVFYSDGQDAVNVDATDAHCVVIITDGAREEYKVPKSQVDGFNGAEVFLKLTIGELEKYRVRG